MTYWVSVTDANFGWPIANATFFNPAGAQYAASYQGNGAYLVGVGPNQDFFARASGHQDSIRFNTDAVDPNYYYFYLRMQPLPPPPPPPPPPRPPGSGWL
jgi:hypothetical protein